MTKIYQTLLFHKRYYVMHVSFMKRQRLKSEYKWRTVVVQNCYSLWNSACSMAAPFTQLHHDSERFMTLLYNGVCHCATPQLSTIQRYIFFIFYRYLADWFARRRIWVRSHRVTTQRCSKPV